MHNLIVCCDGTWNHENQTDNGHLAPTNVFKIFNALGLDNKDISQQARYQPGVGTGHLLDKISGGALGLGLSEDIRDAYFWLATKYSELRQQGQTQINLYLFGFSRGAFTARSLAGMICQSGLLDLSEVINPDEQVKKLYREVYRQQLEPDSNFRFWDNSNQVHFIGAWDTVGALGIPNDKSLVNLFDSPQHYQFHDTQLSPRIRYARHALAIDEKRGSFTPTLWDEKNCAVNTSLKQIWFAGSHSDIGGGYAESGLSDCSLQWMVDEAALAGLIFDQASLGQIKPDPFARLHDSHQGLMKWLVSAPRSLPNLADGQHFSESVNSRRQRVSLTQGHYLKTRAFDELGIVQFDVEANTPWNWTGVYLEAGRAYRIRATGQWLDASIPAGPKGASDGDFHAGEILHVASSLLGKLEQAWSKLTANEDANLIGTKRVEHADWMALIGSIANGGNPSLDGTPDRLTTFEIGEDCTVRPKMSGYLYCYANDAWGFYNNNRGFLTVTVEMI